MNQIRDRFVVVEVSILLVFRNRRLECSHRVLKESFYSPKRAPGRTCGRVQMSEEDSRDRICSVCLRSSMYELNAETSSDMTFSNRTALPSVRYLWLISFPRRASALLLSTRM